MARKTSSKTTKEVVTYEGQDLYARANFAPAGDTLIVTFSPRRDFAEKIGPRSSGFGEDLFRSEGIPYICFVSKANHWWHTTDTLEAVKFMKPYMGRFRRIITYGVSMGAYGALVMAKPLGATHVLAFSPQTDVSGRLPLNPVWQQDLKDVKLIHDLATSLPGPETRVTLVIDPTLSMDHAHRSYLLGMRDAEILPTPLSGHSTALFLSEMGLLKEIVLDAVAGKLDLRQTRQKIRDRRSTHPLWCNRIATRLEAHNRPGLARAWHSKAVDCLLNGSRMEPDKAQRLIFGHLRRLAKVGSDREYRILVNRLLAHPEYAYCGLVTRAEDLLTSGNIKAAVLPARAAGELRPKAVVPLLLKARILVAKGDLPAAQRHMDKALLLRGGLPQDWAQLATAFEAAGLPEAAALAKTRGMQSVKGGKRLSSVDRLAPA